MSLRKRRIVESESEASSCLDAWFVDETEGENRSNDESIEEDEQEITNDNDSSDESDVPLSQRWTYLQEDVCEWVENSEFNPIVDPFTDENAGVQLGADLNKQSTLAQVFKAFLQKK